MDGATAEKLQKKLKAAKVQLEVAMPTIFSAIDAAGIAAPARYM